MICFKALTITMKFFSAIVAATLFSASVEGLTTQKPFRFGQQAMASSTATAASPRMVGGYDLDISEIFEGNEKFVEEKLAKDPKYFDTLGTVHSPKYLYIGKERSHF